MSHCNQDDPAQAAAIISSAWNRTPFAGIVLGTGLGLLADRIDADVSFAAGSLPGFCKPASLSHYGSIVCGRLVGVPVMAMTGRIHCYEGFSIERLTLPVRVMKAMGVGVLIATNAAGGLNQRFAEGDVMVIDDHINLLNRNSRQLADDEGTWSGKSAARTPYDVRLRERAMEVARRQDIVCHRGVYVAMLGPNYETRAEVRMLRRIGGDAVGMSTVPEAIVAAQSGLRVLGLSIITNCCSPEVPRPATGDRVAEVAAAASARILKIVAGTLHAECRA
jgi:purine-nucleoside phosphorylase